MVLSKATRSYDTLDTDHEKEEKRLRKLSNIVLIDYIKNMSQLLFNELQNRGDRDETGSNRKPVSPQIPLEYEEHI